MPNVNGLLGVCTTLAVVFSLQFTFAVSSGAQVNRPKSQDFKKIEDLLTRTSGRVDTQSTAAESKNSFDVRVRWNAYVTNQPRVRPGMAQLTPGGGFVISQVRLVPEPVTLPRSPELSTDRLLVAAYDAQERLRGWALVTDPRILRQEQPSATGELKGQMLHHTTPEFVITLPEDPTIVELRFYSPIWSGQEFSLQLIGTVPFRVP